MIIQKGIYIEDRYEILEKIGSGGMSDVYKARCHKLNRFVAIKFLKPEFCEDKNFVKNFQIEAQSAAALLHPNVVSVYDVNQTDGVYYIVMEYVDGITLKKYIDRNGRLPIKEATSIAIQIAQGIDAAHNANIIHRDIKPQNVLISREGKIKVTDFGIARTTTANTISTDILGSVQYISPEQARGGQVDNRTDIYSFGIVFYEMITGKLPFDGDSTVAIALKHIQEDVPLAGHIVDGVPNSVSKIIEKCTQRKPDRRYQKLSSLLSDLKTSLITPNEDFVVLEPEPSDSATIIMSDEEAEYIRREAGKPLKQNYNRSVPRNQRNSSGRNGNAVRNRRHEEAAYYGSKQVRNPQSRKKQSKRKKQSDSILIACGIVAGMVIIAVLLFVVIKTLDWPAGSNNDGGLQVETTTKAEDETVTNVVGMDYEQAKDVLTKKGLLVKCKYENSDSIAKGSVIDQSIKNGTVVVKGQEIILTVSSGQERAKLDDYSGQLLDIVKNQLIASGYKTDVIEIYSDTIEEGYVVKTNPPANADADPDTVVEIYVSIGPEIKKVIVPSVMGYTESGAIDILYSKNLNASIEYTDSNDFDGLVMYQFPVPDEEVEENTWVTITVGRYPQNNWADYTEDTTEEYTPEEEVTEAEETEEVIEDITEIIEEG